MHPSSPGSAGQLAVARDAYAARRWGDALQGFQACDAREPLARDDLARLAWCAGMLGRDDDQLAAFERLFRASEAEGDPAAAAYWAFFHGFRLFALQETGRATAWLQRAQRHAGLASDRCAAQGYLLLPQLIRQVISQDWAAAVHSAERALEIAARCREVDLEALARCWLGRALVLSGRVEDGLAVLDEAMLLALGETLSPVVTGLVYCNLIATCRQVYALDRAREWTAALEKWCHSQPQLVQFGGACQLHRAEILELDGAWGQSLAAAGAASQRGARAAGDDVRAGAAYQEGEIHRLRGEWEEAQRCYAEAHLRGLDPQPGLALARLARGDAHEAVGMLRRSVAAATPQIARARQLPALVEALLETGAVDDAREAAAQLQALARECRLPALEAAAAQAEARVELATGDAASALPRLQQALATWLRLRAPYLAAATRVQIALACRELGDAAGMRMHLEAARESFAWLGAAPALRKVEALLSGGESAPGGVLLSRRELEVVRLLAAGHSNKGIARELGLSEKTVDRHLSNIFGKLDVHTRSAATAYAYRHGLVRSSP